MRQIQAIINSVHEMKSKFPNKKLCVYIELNYFNECAGEAYRNSGRANLNLRIIDCNVYKVISTAENEHPPFRVVAE